MAWDQIGAKGLSEAMTTNTIYVNNVISGERVNGETTASSAKELINLTD